MLAILDQGMLWKMGKAKSNSTFREGCLDMPCTLLVEPVLFREGAIQSCEVLRDWDYRVEGGPWGSSS